MADRKNSAFSLNLVRCGVSLVALLASGCVANSFIVDSEPRKVRIGKAAEPAEYALVLGQAYEFAPNSWSNLIVKYVDGHKAYSEMDLRTAINFLIPSGQHTLKVEANYGNIQDAKSSLEPKVTADLQAGEVYQLDGRRTTDSRGESWVQVRLEHIGSMAEYQAFRARNPGFRSGQPLTRAQLSVP